MKTKLLLSDSNDIFEIAVFFFSSIINPIRSERAYIHFVRSLHYRTRRAILAEQPQCVAQNHPDADPQSSSGRAVVLHRRIHGLAGGRTRNRKPYERQPPRDAQETQSSGASADQRLYDEGAGWCRRQNAGIPSREFLRPQGICVNANVYRKFDLLIIILLLLLIHDLSPTPPRYPHCMPTRASEMPLTLLWSILSIWAHWSPRRTRSSQMVCIIISGYRKWKTLGIHHPPTI